MSKVLISKKTIHQYSTDQVRCFLNTAFELNFSIAVWKLPFQDTRHIIVDFSHKTQKIQTDLENSPSGFLVNPFLSETQENPFFIAADLHYSSQNSMIKYDPSTEIYASEKQRSRKIFTEKLTQSIQNRFAQHQILFPEKINEVKSTTKEHFVFNVKKAIKSIEKQDFVKVVLSRKKVELLPQNFDLATTFEKLCRTYPHAFVSLVYIPKVGIWLGASPETLVSLSPNQIFETVSLAGTQHRQPDTNIQDARWTQKEIEEQALVSRYIINCFKKIRLREYQEIGPKTVQAGNLLHLKTVFQVDTKRVHFPELATVMTQLLHPTSAVCGMPKSEALDFIINHEKYDRSLYSGFLGPVNIDFSTNLFVNLRCMQLIKNYGIFYAGAGITQDSVAEKEWEETELKCRTLLNIISNES